MNICRPQILQLNGLSMGDFDDQKAALACADELIRENVKLHCHSGECYENKNMPMLNRYFYVHSQGVKRTWTQTQKKILDSSTDVKNKKQLVDSNAFIEGVGELSSGSAGKASTVKIEEVHITKLTYAKTSLQSFLYMWHCAKTVCYKEAVGH